MPMLSIYPLIMTNFSTVGFMFRKISYLLILLTLSSNAAYAEDDPVAEAQRKMNQEVMEKPFMAAKPEEVDAYIKKAMEKGIKPKEYKGTHWKKGYTCHDLLRYSWSQYRNCKYYYRYHGRYYW